jgi:hypothetical protein
MITFECPSCQTKMQAAEEHVGMTVACPKCEAQTRVPSSAAISAGPSAGAGSANPDAITTPDNTVPGTRRDRDDDDRDDARRDRGGPGLGTGAAVGMGVGMIILIVVGVSVCAVLGVVGILVALLVPAFSKVREAAARTQTLNNMRQIGVAIHSHHDTFKFMPSQKMRSMQGNQPVELSWRVSVLPFLDQQQMFLQFDQNAGWDQGNNKQFLTRRPNVYENVTRPDADKTLTTFQYFTGPNTLFPEPTRQPRMADVTDGTSNTFLFAEAKDGVPWTKPADMVVTKDGPLPLPENQFLACMVDGSVRMVQRRRTDDNVLRLLIDPTDGRELPMGWGE